MCCKAIIRNNWKLFLMIAAASVLSNRFLGSIEMAGLEGLTFDQFSKILGKVYWSEENVGEDLKLNFSLLDLVLHFIGWICAWPFSNCLGRKWSIVYSNILRLIALLLYATGICFYAFFKDMPIHYFHLMGQLCESVYAGLLSILGPLYVYEILPGKPSADVGTTCAASGICLYFFLKHLAEYLKYIILPELTIDHYWNYPWWGVAGVALGVSMLLQTLLFVYCFPESPADLAIQREKWQTKNTEEAIPSICADLEINPEEIQRDLEVQECAKRSRFLMMLYFQAYYMIAVFVRYHGTILLYELLESTTGVLHLENSVHLISYLFAFIWHKWSEVNLKLETLRTTLFFAYAIVIALFPILYISLEWRRRKFMVEISLLLLSVISLLWLGCIEVITRALLLQYPGHANRAKNYICAQFLGLGLCIMVHLAMSRLVSWLYPLLRNYIKPESIHVTNENVTLVVMWLVLIGMFLSVKGIEVKYDAYPHKAAVTTEMVVTQTSPQGSPSVCLTHGES